MLKEHPTNIAGAPRCHARVDAHGGLTASRGRCQTRRMSTHSHTIAALIARCLPQARVWRACVAGECMCSWRNSDSISKHSGGHRMNVLWPFCFYGSCKSKESIMSVPAAYIGVILIWSTTPLAINWSSQEGGFLFGVTGRMLLGAVVCLLLIRALRVVLPWHRAAARTYLAAGLGIYGAMISTYWGAQYIPSGLISVLFGLTTLAAGVLAVILHSVSSVRVKRLGADVPALAVTAGGLLVAAPLYLATWYAWDGRVPQHLPLKTSLAIIYLGVVGSVVGFVLYYYALKHLTAARIALITLVTPVTALLLGRALNDEHVGIEVWRGTAVILLGLVLYQRSERE